MFISDKYFQRNTFDVLKFSPLAPPPFTRFSMMHCGVLHMLCSAVGCVGVAEAPVLESARSRGDRQTGRKAERDALIA